LAVEGSGCSFVLAALVTVESPPSGNPLEDIDLLQRVSFVMLGGEVVKEP